MMKVMFYHRTITWKNGGRKDKSFIVLFEEPNSTRLRFLWVFDHFYTKNTKNNCNKL